MRISEWTGVWIKYRDSARPVIALNQILYAFNNEARECLVSREDHVQYFLQTGQYRIAGIEVAPVPTSLAKVVPEPVVREPVVREPVARRGGRPTRRGK